MNATNRGPWRPSGLADFEITAEIADPATSPQRRRALLDEQEARKADHDAALEHARRLRAQVEQRVASLLGAGVPS